MGFPYRIWWEKRYLSFMVGNDTRIFLKAQLRSTTRYDIISPFTWIWDREPVNIHHHGVRYQSSLGHFFSLQDGLHCIFIGVRFSLVRISHIFIHNSMIHGRRGILDIKAVLT